jgi:hypothetical protein
VVKRWFSCKTVEQMSQVLFVRFFTSRGKNEQITNKIYFDCSEVQCTNIYIDMHKIIVNHYYFATLNTYRYMCVIYRTKCNLFFISINSSPFLYIYFHRP